MTPTEVNELIFLLQDGHFTYAYRLQPGVNRESHGLKVAQLAGLPPDALSVASQTLNWLKRREPESLCVPEIIHR
jgi:DNA mismatch repair ATPase MutS